MAYNKETGMYEGYIYEIYNDINDKIYIGQTIRSINQRWNNYKCNVKNNEDDIAIHNAMRKYSIDVFHIKQIQVFQYKTKEELQNVLNEKEIFYIDKYNSRVPNGYNIAIGGSVTNDVNCREVIMYDPYNEEEVSYNSIDEASYKNKIPGPNIISCCQGKNFSAKNKIFKYKEDGICKDDIEKFFTLHPIIYQYDLNGNKLNKFYNTTDAANYIIKTDNIVNSASIILKSINDCSLGKKQTAYGYVWRRNSDSFDLYKLNKNYNRNKIKNTEREIDVYDINGIFINTYDNIKLAFESLEIYNKQTNQALMCCQGKSPIAFDYVWRYHNEPFDKYSCAIINGNIRINKYTSDGVFIKSYKNYKSAAKSVKTTNTKAISDCCKNKNHLYRGFLWFYINDPNQPDETKIIN